MNSSDGTSLGKFYGYKESFGNDTVWVDIPQQCVYCFFVTDIADR